MNIYFAPLDIAESSDLTVDFKDFNKKGNPKIGMVSQIRAGLRLEPEVENQKIVSKGYMALQIDLSSLVGQLRTTSGLEFFKSITVQLFIKNSLIEIILKIPMQFNNVSRF